MAEKPETAAPWADSAEFKNAVAAAAKEAAAEAIGAALPELLAQLAGAGGTNGAVVQPSTSHAVIGDLALQLAELTSQNSGRIYVAPEILEKRRRAREELKTLLLDLHRRATAFAEGHPGTDNPFVPSYRLTAKTQLSMPGFGPILLDPLERDTDKVVRPTEIDWPGIPNQAMEPINDAAKEVWELFRLSLDNMMPETDVLHAVNAAGAVVRGAAAAAIRRNAGERETSAPDGLALPPADGVPIAAIRRRETGQKKLAPVLGTVFAPIEMR